MRGRTVALGVILVVAPYAAIACSTFSGDAVPSEDAAADTSSADVNATSDAGDAATGDAADGGSSWTPCKMRAPAPFFCADFDESMPAIYQGGGASQPPAATANTTASFRAPAVSDPSALWIETTGGNYQIDARGTSSVKRLAAAFDVRFDVLSPDPVYAIAAIGMRNQAWSHCYGYLGLDQKKVRVKSHCSIMPVDGGLESNFRHRDVSVGLPLAKQWIHVELAIDVGATPQTVTIRLGNAAPVVHDLDVQPPFADVSAGGTPYFAIGIGDHMTTAETVAFDNIVVD